MIIEKLVVGPIETNCYLVSCEKTGKTLVIDPGDEGERILRKLNTLDLKPVLVVNTHGHFDHIGAVGLIVEKTGAKFLIHEDALGFLENAKQDAALFGISLEKPPSPSRFLAEGDIFHSGDIKFTVLHTPGHSPGGICILTEGHIFTGDTLFAGSVGRTDLPGGNHRLLIKSIQEKLMKLPDETEVLPGHGPVSTIGREKKINPFIQ